MSYSPLRTNEKTVASSQITDAVLAYMTSVKQIKKRSGELVDFQIDKLERSVREALTASGMNANKWGKKIVSQVLSRLVRRFDGHTVPEHTHVRETVVATFIDNGLTHTAKRYLTFDKQAALSKREPVYGNGLTFERYFTKEGVHPFDMIAWEKRDARITNEKGKVVFEQIGVEAPSSWSQTATNIVVSKYFRGQVGKDDRETSVKQMIRRVATTMADWGRCDGYFQTAKDADVFEAELTHILANQMAAFNSPVWFNVGVAEKPQCSACFINSVQDDMRSILQLAMTEGMLFKGGSGAGSNFSNLRSKQEYLAGSNGRASGPVSFMKGLDAFAGVIKSGGKTRRAAKMVILNVDHPDIEDFITCKAEEEKKAWALMDAGYDGSMDGAAYSSIYFQNANNSVRVTDEFMRAVENDATWVTREVTTGKDSVTYPARELMRKMGEAAWQCGDPGIQYDTTINRWHTCKTTDHIHASNPCSEYMFLDDTACNLASLNLMKFRKQEAGLMVFDVASFKRACEVIITAMEIVVGNSSYPTPAIEQGSFDFRTLGIGFANLGALLMSQGLAYDSDSGRNMAAAITSVMSGTSYAQSARIAEHVGPFARFKENRESCLEVLNMHRAEALKIDAPGLHLELLAAARHAWDDTVMLAENFGVRNAQISVLAPTGTIAFLMDCDTTGVEPDIALVKYKWLVGGGMIKIVNQTVPEALTRLGYTDEQKQQIIAYIDEKDTIEGAPHLKEEHLSVFDCAFKAANGTRTIHYKGHLRMMGAVQPFISGAISKTVNMPHEATVEDIMEVYKEGWRMGLKAIAIYRDGSKRQQALTTSKEKDAKKANQTVEEPAKKEETAVPVASVPVHATAPVAPDYRPRRRRMPDERRAITHKFSVGNYEGYITVGLYDDGMPGEIFVTMSKQGSVIRGLIDSFATAISLGLQYGVPLEVLVNKFVHMRFEPSGYTNNPQIRIAKSIIDYLFRWMAMKFLPRESQFSVGINMAPADAEGDGAQEAQGAHETDLALKTEAPQSSLFETTHTATFDNQSDAPACDTCGSIMVRNGACYKCLNCGGTSGCS